MEPEQVTDEPVSPTQLTTKVEREPVQIEDEPAEAVEATEAPAEEPAEQEASETPAAEEPKGSERSPEARRALEILKLKESGPPDELLSQMDDQQLIDWAERKQSTYKTVDEVFLEKSRLSKEIAELKTQIESQAAKEPEQATPAGDEDLTLDWGTLSEQLGIDEEEGREVLDGTIGKVFRQQQQEIQRLSKALVSMGEGYLVDSVRANLAGEVPALNDAAYFERVDQTMKDLSGSPRFEGLEGRKKAEALMRAAMALEPPPQSEAPPDPVVETAKRNGSPMDPTPSRAPKGSQPELSFEERLKNAAKLMRANPQISKGDPVQGARYLRQQMGA